jgi:hypothetical protein
MSRWKPDEVIHRPDGWRTEIRRRRREGEDGGLSQTRKLIDPENRTRYVWHEVLDARGNLVQQDEKEVDEGS